MCTRDRKWSRVASRMGYGSTSLTRGLSPYLTLYFQAMLQTKEPLRPFCDNITRGYYSLTMCFKAEPPLGLKLYVWTFNWPLHQFFLIFVSTQEERPVSDEDNDDKISKTDRSINDSTPEKRVLRRQSISPSNQNPLLISPNSQNKELKKLQVYGAGPKMPGYVSDHTAKEQSVKVCPERAADSDDSRDWSLHLSQVCLHCGEANPTPMLLTCDNCTNTYHTHCLIPPLNDWPKGIQ